MQATRALTNRQEQAAVRPRGTAIGVEFLVYLTLTLLALVLRLAQLDTVPMSAPEARQALAAWRAVQPEAAGSPIVAESPLLFTLHTVTFSTLGASEFTARVWTALAGVGLSLSPLLFRKLLGAVRAITLSVMLVFSPVLLVASRTGSTTVWTVLIAIVGLWAAWRWWEMVQTRLKIHRQLLPRFAAWRVIRRRFITLIFRRRWYAVLATVCLAAIVYLTDPTGPFFAIVMTLAAVYAFWARPAESIDPLPAIRRRLKRWPLPGALLASAVVVALVSTILLFYPAGLSGVGELLGASIRDLVTPRAGTPAFFPFLIGFFYEPMTLILGVVAVVWLTRMERFTFVERFLADWAIFGAAFGLVYAGAGPEHALWLTLPLTGLGSALVSNALTARKSIWGEVPGYVLPLIGLVLTALLGMFSIHLHTVARALVNSPDNILPVLTTTGNAVFLLFIALFMVIGFFLAASVWGNAATLRGTLLGALAFMLLTSLGSGWHAAVTYADNPVEFWNRRPTSRDTLQLRDLLIELSRRETGGFPLLTLTVAAPDDGVVAWLLRDYPNVEYIPDASAARTQPIVLLPLTAEPPDLGSSYVGQRFTITSGWDFRTIKPADFLAWWTQRHTRTVGVPVDVVVLWLRQDVYDGAPFDPAQ